MGGTTQADKVARAVLMIAGALCCAGCVTPLAVGRGHVGIGLFRQTVVPEVAGVRTASIEGVGLVIRSGGVSLGYIEIEETVIDPAGSLDGVVVVTPRMTIATGRKAEAVAASEGALIDFLVEPTAPGALGVLP